MTFDQILFSVAISLLLLLLLGSAYAGYLDGRAARREVHEAGRDLPLRDDEPASPRWVSSTLDTLAVEGALTPAGERLQQRRQ